MQANLNAKQQIFPNSGRFVGARGANAAQRAAHALHIANAAKVENADAQDNAPSGLREEPAARAPVGVPPAKSPEVGAAVRRQKRKLALIGAALALAVASTGWLGYRYLAVGRFMVSTDDAYVRADATTLAAKVGGYVTAIGVAGVPPASRAPSARPSTPARSMSTPPAA